MACLLLASVALVSVQAKAQDTELTVTPNKCVAISKGTTCYRSLIFRYNSTSKADICLVIDDNPEPLACWRDKAAVEYRYRFASNESLLFRIIDAGRRVKASASVDVAWVYRKSRKRNRWRLF